MYQIWVFLLLTLFSFVCQAHVPTEGKISASLGPFLHRTHNLSSQNRGYSPFLVGAGLLVEGDVDGSGGVEIGLFYNHKTYLRQFSDGQIVEKVHKVTVPIGYRHWFSESFSAALLFSTSYSMGDYVVVFSDTLSNETTSAREITEYGFEPSFQWEFWRDNQFALVADGRYFISANSKSGEDANQFELLFLVKYLVQEKE
jgi:hypothetical protein